MSYMYFICINYFKVRTRLITVSLIILAGWQQAAIAQSRNTCDLNSRIWMRSNDTVLIEEIEEEVFSQYSHSKKNDRTHEVDSNSLEQVLINKYDFLEKKDNCLHISFARKDLEFCNVSTNDNTYSRYQLTSHQTGKYLTVYATGYESWNYYLLDLKDEKMYVLPGPPRIIDHRYIFGESHYYGDHDFKIYDVQTNDSLIFTLEETTVDAAYIKGEALRFKAKSSCNEDGTLVFRYYEVVLDDGL